jgi:hypothetical protein
MIRLWAIGIMGLLTAAKGAAKVTLTAGSGARA